MSRYVVANWKSHKTLEEARQWMTAFGKLYRPDPHVQVIIAPPSVYLVPLWQMIPEDVAANLFLAVQDISPFPLGAYTGAVAAEMVRQFAEYGIVGHSERRRYFHETNQEIANKLSEAAAAKIKPLLCVDQPYAAAQLAALDDADTADLIIGYGPVEAIGIDREQSPEQVGRAIAEIQGLAPGKPILYGGSIHAKNSGNYMRIPGISGLMVGTASLDPEEFAAICRVVAST